MKVLILSIFYITFFCAYLLKGFEDVLKINTAKYPNVLERNEKQTRQTNPLQCNQCLLRKFECVLRFECFYISERLRRENIVDLFFHTRTKKAYRGKMWDP